MAALTSAAPAFASAAPVSSPGPLTISQLATGTETINQVETFTITVTNTTTGVANNVFLGDTLPAGARLTGPLPNPNLCARTGSGGLQAFACLAGPLDPGASFSISFQIIPNTSSIDNHAATTGFAGGSFVSNAVDLVIALSGGSTTTTATTTSTSTDVQITGSASTGQPTAGSSFGYVYQIKNNGPLVASGVSFTDTLPSGVGYIGSANSLTGACSNNAATVSCSLGDLAVGASAVVSIRVTAPTGLTSGATITNVGNATSATADTNSNNNSVAVTVRVQ